MQKFAFVALAGAVLADKPSFNGDVYIAKSAEDKSKQIWDAVTEDPLSADWYSAVQLGTLFTESMAPVFETPGDELPKGMIYGTRGKYIHTVGVVGQVEWVSVGTHPYTGIFEGADKGFIRCSLAAEPVNTVKDTTPGFGLKFVRDGIDSANLVAMYSTAGQTSWNYFLNDFTNHIPSAVGALIAVAKKFATYTKYVTEVALTDFASYSQQGTQVTEPKYPFSLRFHPTGDISTPDDYAGHTLWVDMMAVPEGSTLYQVFAMDKPTEMGGTETHIGDLNLTSKFTTSKWGDEHFFVRHEDMNHDLDKNPDWVPYTPKFHLFGDK